MRSLRITRRDPLLVATTAIVAFAIAVPLTGASSQKAARQFTVWPGSSARFANMGWSCDYHGKDAQAPATVECSRESTVFGAA
jgi:hypothetical protein